MLTSSAASNAAACPTSTAPTATSGSYQVAFKASFDNVKVLAGYNEQQKEWAATVSGVTGTACGLLQIPSFQAVIEPQNIIFDTSHAVVSIVNGNLSLAPKIVLTLTPQAPVVATVTGVNPDGTLEATGSADVLAHVIGETTPSPGNPSQPIFTCDIQANATATTGTSTVDPNDLNGQRPPGPQWTVSGTALHGPLSSGQGTIVANDFSIPSIPSPGGFDPSTCWLAGAFNSVLSGYRTDGSTYLPADLGAVNDPPSPPGEAQLSADLHVDSVDLGVLDTPLPADCVPHSGPPYQIGVHGTFLADFGIGSEVSANGVTGTFCGIASVAAPPPGSSARVCAVLTIPNDGLTLNNPQATLHLLPGVTTVISHFGVALVNSDVEVCNSDATGPLTVSATISARAQANVLGAQCNVPITAPITAKIFGPLQSGATVTLTSGPFAIPLPTVSPLCPADLSSNAGDILKLPQPPGAATFSLTATAFATLPPGG